MAPIDPVQVSGVKKLRQEYLLRHPNGGDFKQFLEKYDAVRQAINGERTPVHWYGHVFGRPDGAGRAGRALLDDGVDETGDATEEIVSPPASLPQDDAGRLALLQQAGLATGATSLQDALTQLELPFMFAGREQWVQNLTNADGERGGDPRLWNVTMESPVHDQSALNLLLGRAHDALANGRTLADDLAYWQTLVPEWAPRVRDQLESQGIPFSVELIASPEINLTDPSKPLFEQGSAPTSLHGLGVEQAGEGTFLRSLSAEELMTQLWPLAYRYHHRPAGAPVPQGFEAGLTFGSPVLRPDGTYQRSPVMATDAYKRWAALGFPGDPTQNGVVSGPRGTSYNPLLGTGKATIGGGITASSPRDVVISSLGVIGAAAMLGDPSIYFGGERAPYTPANLSQDTLDRLRALMGA